MNFRSLLVLLLCLAEGGACLERGSDKEATKAQSQLDLPAPPKPSASSRLRRDEPPWPAKKDATIVVRLASEPLHLNPLLAGDSIAVRVTLGDVYESLLSIEKPGQRPRPGLAKSFVRSTDGKEWTFYLRKGVVFHGGQRLQPSDVVRSFELARKAPGPLQTDFDDLLETKVEGRDAVIFRFGESRSSRSEAFASVPIFSRKDLGSASAQNFAKAKVSLRPNGTGPLRFGSWKGGVIELTRFEAYWGPKARAQTIQYRVIADRSRVMAELRSGGVDIALRLPIDEALQGLEENEELVLVKESLPAYTAAVFNTGAAYLDIDTRLALSRSFDRDSLVRELYRGYSSPAFGPYPEGSESNDPRAKAQEFSLSTVKEELAEHWSDPKRSLRLLVPAGSRTMQRLADIWAEDLRGTVKVQIESVPFADMLQRVRSGDFDLCLLSFTTSSEVDLYSLFHSSQVGSGNLSRLQDPAVDLLLDGLRGAHSSEERRDRGRELHRLLLHLAPFAFLATDQRLGLVRKDVAGLGDSAPGGGARNHWRRQ